MARTKQTARKTPSPDSYKKRKNNSWKVSVEQEGQAKKRKLLVNQFENVLFPSDMIIITTSEETSDDVYSSSIVAQTSCLHLNKLNEHVCSGRCFDCLPQLNWPQYNSLDDCYSVVKTIYEKPPIFAPRPDELDTELLQHVLNQVKKAKDQFSVRILTLKMEENEIDQHTVKSIIYEYTKCGMKCYYSRSREFEYETFMIFIGKEEYVCLGHYYNFPYYIIPYVIRANEGDDNAPNLCETNIVERIETAQDGSSKEIPILLPLENVLENLDDFLEMLSDDFN